MKKRFKPWPFLLVLALLPGFGCAVVEVLEIFLYPANHPSQYRDVTRHQKAGDTWRGAHIGELIAAWGKPGKSVLSSKPDQQGWRVYSWFELHSEEQEGEWVKDDKGFQVYQDGETYTYTCSRLVTAGPDGVIKETSFSGTCDYFKTPATRPEVNG